VLPADLYQGLVRAGLPAAQANSIAHLPPVSALFAAFLGYNPMATLLGASALHQLSTAAQATLLGKTFFPNLIANSFMGGLRAAFYISAAICLIAAIASLLRGRRYVHGATESRPDASATNGNGRQGTLGG
jgi:hypothetical protein